MLTETPYYGQTSRVDRAQVRYRVTCTRCSSDLGARYQGMRTWGTALADWWECGCGARRIIKREAIE